MSDDVKTRASSSFGAHEIEAANQIFHLLRRGGDPRAIMRTEDFRSLERKFVLMGKRAKPAQEHGRVYRALPGIGPRPRSSFELAEDDVLERVFGDG